MNLFRSALFASALVASLPAQDQQMEEISALLAPYLDDGPGGVLWVEMEGELLHRQAFGLQRADRAEANAADTRFYVASTAKMWTAACVHLLALDGALDLDSPLSQHFPELAQGAEGITVRHLLHHRSGLRDFYELGVLIGWDLYEPPPREQVLELLARQRGLNFAPGIDGAYSNSNYLLLAWLVERVSGQDFAAFARERLFAPLGMEHTDFGLVAADAEGVAVGHVGQGGSFAQRPVRNRLVGAGGAWSTAADLLRWSRVFQDEEWQQLRDALCAPFPRSEDQWLDLALGDYRAGVMYREPGGVELFLHPGGYLGSQALFLHVPELALTVAAVANRGDLPMMDLGFRIAALLGVEPDDASVDAGAAAPPAGRRLLRGPQGEIALFVTQGSQMALQGLGFDLRFVAQGADRGATRGGAPVPLQVQIGDEAVRLSSLGCSDRIYRVLSNPAAQRTDLDEQAGIWWCEELDAEIELSGEGGRLQLVGGAGSVSIPPFRPLARDVYISVGQAQVLVEFVRDAGGQVVEARLGTDRARGMRLTRPD